MEWHLVAGDPGPGGSDSVEWERGDRCARIVLRETGTGAWAVTLDRLAQAPRGQRYHRETVADREQAVVRATQWRRENDRSNPPSAEDP